MAGEWSAQWRAAELGTGADPPPAAFQLRDLGQGLHSLLRGVGGPNLLLSGQILLQDSEFQKADAE